MPIYEYECRECGYRLDALQKLSDLPLTDCPECSQSSLDKLISAPHFQLKGSGWYETDFKHAGGKKPDDKAGGESKASSENGKDAGKGKTEASGSGSAKKSAASGASAS